ncbi:MAG: UPF0164 family protein [Treponema sp.]|nr:UPF0164 family protein [Treponema sp.]
MKKSVISGSIIFILSFVLQHAVFSLDLSPINNRLSNFFYTTIDKNEGTTSFRSLNIPCGGRAESLGTAYTALADDISFFDYNPAASCILENTEVAVFHNAWIADSALETIAATSRYNNFGAGFQLKCFYVPFTEYNLYGERQTGNYYSETTGTVNFSYNFLAGYYFKGIATGINLKGSWRSIPDFTDNDTGKIISGSGREQSGAAAMVDTGIILRFNIAKFYADRKPNLNIGLSLMNMGAAWTGFGKQIIQDDPLPTRAQAGIAYTPFAPLTWTAEIRQPILLPSLSESEQWSTGTGLLIRITPFFNLLGGFLLQGANPRFSLGGECVVNKMQLNINYTFDLTTSFNPVNHISVSAKINLGDKGRAQLRKQVDQLYQQGLQYYAEGQLQFAITVWQEALYLDPRFDPAIEALKAAKQSTQLYQRVMDIQSLD